jgi:hypothetical protein
VSERPRHRAHYCPVDETSHQLLGAATPCMHCTCRFVQVQVCGR